MKLLVTGRAGQVARSIAERCTGRSGIELVLTGWSDLDLTDPDSIRRAIAAIRPDVVINAAAYTAVDLAEDEPELAEAVNAVAPGVLAEAVRDADGRLIHLSTDYVFDGAAGEPYREDMPTGPLGVYGRTKLAGEEAVRAAGGDHLILRSAWIYSPFGRNFVKTMLDLAATRERIEVVEDQDGNPTSALDLADGLFAAIERWRTEPRSGVGETLHLAGTGTTSWADFARYIFAESARRGGPSADVVGIASSDWMARAERPLNSRLDSDAFARRFGHRLPDWRQSAATVIGRLLGDRR